MIKVIINYIRTAKAVFKEGDQLYLREISLIDEDTNVVNQIISSCTQQIDEATFPTRKKEEEIIFEEVDEDKVLLD